MAEISRLIEAYRSIRPTVEADGAEDDNRLAIVTQLEDHVGDPRVVEFYLTIIADPEEYDLARIESVKILGLWPPDAQATRRRVGRTIAERLWPDEDYLVRQYAAMSLGPYADDEVVFDAIASVVAHDDDIDVRHNALESVAEAGRDDRTVTLLRSLVDDPELGSAAARTLHDWSEPRAGGGTHLSPSIQ